MHFNDYNVEIVILFFHDNFEIIYILESLGKLKPTSCRRTSCKFWQKATKEANVFPEDVIYNVVSIK